MEREIKVFMHEENKFYGILLVNGKPMTENGVVCKPEPLYSKKYKDILLSSGLAPNKANLMLKEISRNIEYDKQEVTNFSPYIGFNNTTDKYYWSGLGEELSKDTLDVNEINGKIDDYTNWLTLGTTPISHAVIATSLMPVLAHLYNTKESKSYSSLTVNIAGRSSIGKSTLSDFIRHMYIDNGTLQDNYLSQNPTDAIMGKLINGKQGTVVVREDQTKSKISSEDITNMIYRFSSGILRQTSESCCMNYLVTLLTSSEESLEVETSDEGVLRRFLEFNINALTNDKCKTALFPTEKAFKSCKSLSESQMVPELTKAFILNCIENQTSILEEIDTYFKSLTKKYNKQINDEDNIFEAQLSIVAVTAIAWKYYLLTVNEYSNTLSQNVIDEQVSEISDIIVKSFIYKTEHAITAKNMHKVLVEIGVENGYPLSKKHLLLDSHAFDLMKIKMHTNISSTKIHRIMGDTIAVVKREVKGKNTTGYYIPVEFGKATMGGNKK